MSHADRTAFARDWHVFRVFMVWSVALLAGVAVTSRAYPETPAPLAKVEGSVVRLHVFGTDEAGEAVDRYGTGVLTTSDGFILTACHTFTRKKTGETFFWNPPPTVIAEVLDKNHLPRAIETPGKFLLCLDA